MLFYLSFHFVNNDKQVCENKLQDIVGLAF